MKWLVVIVCFLSSCRFGFNPQGYVEKNIGFEEAWRLTADFVYMLDDDGGRSWKSPNEFEQDGGGDCEDFAIYMIYLLGPNVDSSMVIILHNGNQHAIVRVNDVYFDPQMFGKYYDKNTVSALFEYNYNYLMSFVTLFGWKGAIE